MFKCALIFLFLTIQTQISFAGLSEADCPVSIDETAMGPIRNQGRTELCFAFAAADLLSHDLGRQVSALSTGLSYYRHLVNSNKTENTTLNQRIQRANEMLRRNIPLGTEGGWDIDALLAASTGMPICSEASMRSHFSSNLSGVQFNWQDEENELQEIFVRLTTTPPTNRETCQTSTALVSLFGQNQQQAIDEFLQSRNDPNSWGRLQDQICERIGDSNYQRGLRNRIVNYPRDSSAENIQKEIDLAMRLGRPVSIGYNLALFNSHSYDEILNLTNDYNSNQKGPTVNPFRANHASIIVGRRWNSRRQSCEYKIRDSYGNRCSKHKSQEFNCENGYFYIDEKLISTVAQDATYIRSSETPPSR